MHKKGKIILMVVLILLILVFWNRSQLKIHLLNQLVVLRGILAPNCMWYNVSDLVLHDGAGVNLYNEYKQKYGAFVPSHMFNEKIYIVTSNKYIKTILENSPDIFSVGKLKKRFFKSFMANNVGVSTGCPWKQRRHINERALVTGYLHTFAKKYNMDMERQLVKWQNARELSYSNFEALGKKMVANIVFNEKRVSNDVFSVFSEANSPEVFFNPNFKLNPAVYNNYLRILKRYMQKPNRFSLIELVMKATKNQNEALHQIPHFIFPIVGLFVATIPRLLLLLCNHTKVFKEVIEEINASDGTYEGIYRLRFVRKCILETLRLNNPVITTFRTLTEDYRFDAKYSFKKGTQFLILNNPVLREKEFYVHPNRFNPSRWTPQMEQSFYALSFNQGPQKCPGKELAIYLVQCFMYHLVKVKSIGLSQSISTAKIDSSNVPQVINPCKIRFYFN